MDKFVRRRGWYDDASRKPQTTINLAASLAIEAAELLECFQWRAEGDPDAVADELADVVLYAAQLANVSGIDLGEAVAAKLARNEMRTWDAEVAR
ncbi:MAG TPA: MazG-like family protein [Solirubrobacteraceae bacterium]|jgi:NTP pyrophosphatase (non-canonical NTP hydrolase)